MQCDVSMFLPYFLSTEKITDDANQLPIIVGESYGVILLKSKISKRGESVIEKGEETEK